MLIGKYKWIFTSNVADQEISNASEVYLCIWTANGIIIFIPVLDKKPVCWTSSPQIKKKFRHKNHELAFSIPVGDQSQYRYLGTGTGIGYYQIPYTGTVACS
jgi:hypothetical protein